MKFVIDHSVAFLYKCGYYRLVSAGQSQAQCQSLIRDPGSWWTFQRGQTTPRTSSSTGWRASRSRRRTMLLMTWDTSWVRLTRLLMSFRWGIFVMSGIHKDREDELEELMPSCFCLNMVDCITVRISSVFCRNKRWTIRRVVICDEGVAAQWYHGGKLSSRWAAIVRDYILLRLPGSRVQRSQLLHYDSPTSVSPDCLTWRHHIPGFHRRLLSTQNNTDLVISRSIFQNSYDITCPAHSTPVPSLTPPSSRDRLGPVTALALSREK